METGTIVWQPSAERIEASNYTAFLRAAEKRTGKSFPGYADLHAWSIEDIGGFWDLVWDFCGVIGDKGERQTTGELEMPGTRFFPDARMSFAENLMRGSGDGEAMIFRGEDKVSRRWSWPELRELNFASPMQTCMRLSRNSANSWRNLASNPATASRQ